jgi:hypothetical protein
VNARAHGSGAFALLPVAILLSPNLALIAPPVAADQSPLHGPEPLSMITSYLCNYPCAELSSPPLVMVTYKDTQGDIPLALMHGVVRWGQTLYSNQTLSMTFDAGESRTVPFYVGGLAAGLYYLSASATLPNGSALSGTSNLPFQVLQNGSLFIGQQKDWALVKAPGLAAIGSKATQASYRNSLNFTVTGTVFLILHNSMGQTVSYSTSTLNLSGGGNGTVYNVIFGIPPGKYYATIFVTSISWVPISNSTSFSFTI